MILGLTGGIASGKTTVAQILVDLGAQLVEADDVGRQVVEPGTIGLERVVEAFGPEVLTPSGSLNRKLVGRLVFQDSAKLQLLNSILHPLMEEEMRRRLVLLEPQGPVVLSAAILFEAGWDKLVDKVLLVWLDPETQLSRLMERDNLTREEAEARIQAQMPLESKIALADYIIDNSKPLFEVRRQVEKIWREINEEDCTHRSR